MGDETKLSPSTVTKNGRGDSHQDETVTKYWNGRGDRRCHQVLTRLSPSTGMGEVTDEAVAKYWNGRGDRRDCHQVLEWAR